MDEAHGVAPAEDKTTPDQSHGKGIWLNDPIYEPGLALHVPFDSLPKFEYGPRLPEGHIRLLVLGQEEERDLPDSVNWFLASGSLSEWQQNYIAISYTWGDPAKTRRIRCNGMSLPVTENVYEALTNIRDLHGEGGYYSGSPKIWIDTVCINQEHFQEREEQVKLMRDIYKGAYNTLVWLPVRRGVSEEEVEKIDKGFDSMVMLDEIYQMDEFKQMVRQGRLSFDTLDHMKAGEQELRVPWENRDGIRNVYSQLFFERIWICQEVAVSPKTVVYDGKHFMPWEFLADIAEIVQHLGGLRNAISWESGKITTDETLVSNVLRLESFRKRFEEEKETGLLELLNATANFKSTEPLDRVYGLLGLVTNEQDHEIIISLLDYTMAPYILYLNVTVNHIIRHGTLDILHLVGPVHYDPAREWLSFVPNFAASDNHRRGIGTLKSRNDWVYHASLDTEPALKIDGQLPEPGKSMMLTDTNEISLSGFVLDSVCRTSDMLDSAGLSMASMMTWFQVALHGRSGSRFIPGGVIQRHLDYIASRSKPTEESTAKEPKAALPDDIDPEILKLLENVKLGPNGVPIDAKESQSEKQHDSSAKKSCPEDDKQGAALETKKCCDNSLVPAKARPSGSSPSRDGLGGDIYPIHGITYGSAFWRTLLANRDPREPNSNTKPDAAFAEKYFQPWSRLLLADDGGIMSKIWMRKWHDEHSSSGDKAVTMFAKWVEDASLGRKLFRTEKGYIGTGPETIGEGDLICILHGGQTPYALREEEIGYKFVGACYVHGVMDGEAMWMELEELTFKFV